MMNEELFNLACRFCKDNNLLDEDDIDDTH
nr:MAG TPA: hypothetical protein [Caudoviricetes sp.]